eukprot:12535327-Heterocapsa_arctica.AAC.1
MAAAPLLQVAQVRCVAGGDGHCDLLIEHDDARGDVGGLPSGVVVGLQSKTAAAPLLQVPLLQVAQAAAPLLLSQVGGLAGGLVLVHGGELRAQGLAVPGDLGDVLV